MMLLVLLALTQTPTTTTVNAHTHHGFNNFVVGSPIEIEAHVHSTVFTWRTRPTGTVDFVITGPNGITMLSANVNRWGEAEVFFTPTDVGAYTVVATYLGDPNFLGSD